MTNSRFYRLERIGTQRRKQQNTVRIGASAAIVIAWLDEEHRGIPFQKGWKKYIAARRSLKSHNRRKPLTKSAKGKHYLGLDNAQSTEADNDTQSAKADDDAQAEVDHDEGNPNNNT
jgi:hypothetical protein